MRRFKIVIEDGNTKEQVEMEARSETASYAIGMALVHPSCPVHHKVLDCVCIGDDTPVSEIIRVRKNQQFVLNA